MVEKLDLCRRYEQATDIVDKRDGVVEQIEEAEVMYADAKEKAMEALRTAKQAKVWVSSHVPEMFHSQQLKIFVTWAQILTSFITTFSIPWPDGFHSMLSACYGWFNIDILGLLGDQHSVTCALDTSFYNQLVAHMMMLPVLVGGALLAAFVARRTHPEEAEHAHIYCIKGTGFFVFVLYPGICTKIFTVFKCLPMPDGTEYLVADLSVECFAGEHNEMMGIAAVSLVIYALGIPAVTLWLLWRNKDKIMARDKTFELELGQLYMGYVTDAWYFEVIEMLRKLILSGALIVLQEEGATQILIGALVCMAYTVSFLLVHPLGRGEDFVLQVIASCQLMITLLIGLYLAGRSDESGGSKSEDAVADGILTAMFGLTVCLGFAMTAITFSGDHPWLSEKLATVWGLRHIWHGHKHKHARLSRKRKMQVAAVHAIETALTTPMKMLKRAATQPRRISDLMFKALAHLDSHGEHVSGGENHPEAEKRTAAKNHKLAEARRLLAAAVREADNLQNEAAGSQLRPKNPKPQRSATPLASRIREQRSQRRVQRRVQPTDDGDTVPRSAPAMHFRRRDLDAGVVPGRARQPPLSVRGLSSRDKIVPMRTPAPVQSLPPLPPLLSLSRTHDL